MKSFIDKMGGAITSLIVAGLIGLIAFFNNRLEVSFHAIKASSELISEHKTKIMLSEYRINELEKDLNELKNKDDK